MERRLLVGAQLGVPCGQAKISSTRISGLPLQWDSGHSYPTLSETAGLGTCGKTLSMEGLQ